MCSSRCISIYQEAGGIEQLCGGVMPAAEKAEMMLANFIIPLCLRIGGNDKGIVAVYVLHRDHISVYIYS